MLPPSALARRSIGLFAGLGALSCALTMIFLGARTVMTMGGSCGSGGPYEVAVPCPSTIGWLMPVWILGGLLAVAVYAFSELPAGPRVTMLAWPALFLSLAWAFIEAAFARPGVDWTFVFCGVLFVLMGGGPLLLLRDRDALRRTFWGPPSTPAAPGERRTGKAGDAPVGGEVRWTTSVGLPDDRGAGSRPPRDAPVRRSPRDGLVGQLERLAALHREGRLDDAEYAAAKKRLLDGA